MIYRYRFISCVLLLDLAVGGGLMAAWLKELPQAMLAQDTKHLAAAMCVAVALALVFSLKCALSIERYSNDLRLMKSRYARVHHYDAAIMRYLRAHRTWETSLVTLGLVGTVLGLMIIANGINADAANDIDQVSGLISTLLSGMGTAFATTLVGALGALWIHWHAMLIENQAARLRLRYAPAQ